MQPDISFLLKQNNLQYGDRFRLYTEEPGLEPIYFISLQVKKQLIDIDNNGQREFCREIKNFTKEMKNYYEMRIIESKEYKKQPLIVDSYSLLGGSELLLQYGDVRFLKVVRYDSGDVLPSADGKLIANGDYVFLSTQDGNYACYDVSLFTSEQECLESIWIVVQKDSSLDILLEHLNTKKKLRLTRQNDIWAIKDEMELVAQNKSDYSQENNNIRRFPYFRLLKHGAETLARLDNEFRYMQYRLRKLKRYFEGGFSMPNTPLLLSNLRDINIILRNYIFYELGDMEINEHVVNTKAQEFCTRYEILPILTEIFKLIVEHRLARQFQDTLYELAQTIRTASIRNEQNCHFLYAFMDFLIRQPFTFQIIKSVEILIYHHNTLVEYFHTFRPLGDKGNQMIMPLECVVNKLHQQLQIRGRINIIKILELLCSNWKQACFLNQQGIYRAIKEQAFIKSHTLISVKTLDDKVYVESFEHKACLDDLLVKSQTNRQIMEVLKLLEEQIVLMAQLSLHSNRECSQNNKQTFASFQSYFNDPILNNSTNAAITRILLGFETSDRRDYGFYKIRIVEERTEKKSKREVPSILVELPKQVIRSQKFNSGILKEVTPNLLLYFQRLDDQLCSLNNQITNPFDSQLLLYNIQLLSQLLLQRFVSVKQKKENVILNYFKQIIGRFNIMRSGEQQQKNQQNDIDFLMILRALQRILGFNDAYFRYLMRFGIRQKPLVGQSNIKTEAVNKLKKMHNIFKNQQEIIKFRYQADEPYLHLFDQYFSKLQRSSCKLSLIKRIHQKNMDVNEQTDGPMRQRLNSIEEMETILRKPISSGLENEIKIQICKFIQHFLTARTMEHLNSAFQGLEYIYKENNKFFKKKVKFNLDEFLPDAAATKILGTQFGKLLLQQIYLTSDPKLLDALFKIMWRMQLTSRDFEKSVQEILILTQRSECIFMQSVQQALDYLKDLSECCEKWLRVDLPNNEFYIREMEICSAILRNLSVNLRRMESTEEMATYQHILRQLEVFTILFDIVSFVEKISNLTEVFQSDEPEAKLASSIFRGSIEVLTFLIARNRHNQILAYDLFFRPVYSVYTRNPKQYLTRFFKQLISNNTTLQLQLSTAELFHFVQNFIENAHILQKIVNQPIEVMRSIIMVRFIEIMFTDQRALSMIDIQIEKADKELMTVGKALLRQNAQKLLYAKVIYLKLLTELVVFVSAQRLILPQPTSDSFKSQLFKCLETNIEILKKFYNLPIKFEKSVEINKQFVELCWQLFRFDSQSLIQFRFTQLLSYFNFELSSMLTLLAELRTDDNQQYYIMMLKQTIPLMLIMLGHTRLKNQQFQIPADLQQTMINFIEREPYVQEVVRSISKRYVNGFDAQFYSNCMKNIIQNTLIPHEFMNKLDFILTSRLEPIQNPIVKEEVVINRIKTKSQLWSKAVAKLRMSEAAANTRNIERDYFVNTLLDFSKFYVHQGDVMLQDDDYEYIIINYMDIFKKLVTIVLNLDKIHLNQVSIQVLFTIINRIIHITNNLYRFKEFKSQSKQFHMMYGCINQKDLLSACLNYLIDEHFQSYLIRVSLLKTIRQILEIQGSTLSIWMPYMSTTLMHILLNEIDMSVRDYPYYILKEGLEQGIGILLDIIICLQFHGIYLPIQKKFTHRPRKAIPLCNLSDYILFTQLNEQTYYIHKKAFSVLSKCISTSKDIKGLLNSCKLTIYNSVYSKKVKALTASEDGIVLIHGLTTFITGGATMGLRDGRMNQDHQHKKTGGCLKIL